VISLRMMGDGPQVEYAEIIQASSSTSYKVKVGSTNWDAKFSTVWEYGTNEYVVTLFSKEGTSNLGLGLKTEDQIKCYTNTISTTRLAIDDSELE